MYADEGLPEASVGVLFDFCCATERRSRTHKRPENVFWVAGGLISRSKHHTHKSPFFSIKTCFENSGFITSCDSAQITILPNELVILIWYFCSVGNSVAGYETLTVHC